MVHVIADAIGSGIILREFVSKGPLPDEEDNFLLCRREIKRRIDSESCEALSFFRNYL